MPSTAECANPPWKLLRWITNCPGTTLLYPASFVISWKTLLPISTLITIPLSCVAERTGSSGCPLSATSENKLDALRCSQENEQEPGMLPRLLLLNNRYDFFKRQYLAFQCQSHPVEWSCVTVYLSSWEPLAEWHSCPQSLRNTLLPFPYLR